MTATLTLLQERINLPEGYEVINTVQASTELPLELFVYDQVTTLFSHVATLTDLAYPTVADPEYDYYRQAAATKQFDNVTTALEFANHVKLRLNKLIEAHTADYVAFAGTETVNLPTP